MLCQNCQQRDAKVQIIKSINGVTQKLYLCDQCAKMSQEMNFVFHPGIIPDFLQALFGISTNSKTQSPTTDIDETCSQCGRTTSQIAQAGKLGCSKCYEKFESQLEPLLRRIHGGGRHVGKIPARRGADIKNKVEIQKLKEKLQELVKNEEFESAAVVRDQIRQLEQQRKE